MNLHDELNYPVEEPTVIKGNGNIVLYGLSNRFSTEVPPRLISRVAPEVYKGTIGRINYILDENIQRNMKWFLCGCFMVCCTFGFSLWPSIHLNKHTVLELQKLISVENSILYNSLGLNWSLKKQFIGSPNVVEYVLIIDNIKKPRIYRPD